MSIAAGTIEYTLGISPVSGCGFSWVTDELDTALAGPGSEIVFDDSGKTNILALLSGLAETDFEKSQVKRILTNTKIPENWRVGEALAESYLVHQMDCFFPWPDGRDERKTGSSLPGADLVGFQKEEDEDFFAFGEVKTSAEQSYPPSAIYGRTGLKRQLEDLKDSTEIKDDLVKYLCYRASAAPWKDQYQGATKKYIKNNANVRIIGFLVRDVKPHRDDLRVRVEKLAKDTHTDMKIKLFAVYLSAGSISTLSLKIMAYRKGGAE